jgi:hypothetical protein
MAGCSEERKSPSGGRVLEGARSSTTDRICGQLSLKAGSMFDRGSLFWKRFPALIVALACLLSAACGSASKSATPSIEFTKIPLSAQGGSDKVDVLAGRVMQAKTGQRLVLYAKSGIWWVQPLAAKPFTSIRPDSTWENSTHLGTEYAALLVAPTYAPEAVLAELPRLSGQILAIAIAKGKGFVPAPADKIIHFSGYDWVARQIPSSRGGKDNPYIADNAWTDDAGLLHLRVTRQGEAWACAEVSLTRSLGRGAYSFTVSDVSRMDPAAAMTFYTWDDMAENQQHRELDVEISQWGDPANKNAQYVIQPYYEPENVERFQVPSGPATFSFNWEPHKAVFKTFFGRARGARVLSEHVFSSGVPSPGNETIHMDLYAFGKTRIPMQKESEVVIEKFEYLP